MQNTIENFEEFLAQIETVKGTPDDSPLQANLIKLVAIMQAVYGGG